MPLLRNIQNRRPARKHINPHRILFTSLLLPALALADDEPTSSTRQVTEPFVDQVTGLTMERFFGIKTSFTFAFALPDATPAANSTAAGSFIGRLEFPLVNGEGWGAAGLTGDMEGNFILAAWPDGKGGVMSSFRQAIDEDNPAVVKGNFNVRPLPDGVSVNETSLLYTFLCENCLDSTLGLGPDAASGNAVMGWALSERPPRGDASDPAAFLGFHEKGFGPFTARLAQAKVAGFDAVAAKALDPVGISPKAVATVPNAFQDGFSDDEDSGDEGSDIDGNDSDSGDESDDDD
ncbi:hypothetical protein FPOAC2_02542 [Fusarium poae]|jgi:hypothetical protein|uniref:hypothetical protein n=1 Tax=Fusarium poae TaxID=36050 RepID=UPI001CE92567|nr:hypothetical protein FPOAC1_002449 [Fusarium poae]KAG8676445.1 hypothetical protein FPOAC1_002449 [Fusarium poae]